MFVGQASVEKRLLIQIHILTYDYAPTIRFDGSGADNNYDAGSCVDGRLTSVWNWCSKVNTTIRGSLGLARLLIALVRHFHFTECSIIVLIKGESSTQLATFAV